MNNILVTGASGFIGSALSYYLNTKGYNLKLAVRSKQNISKNLLNKFKVYEIGNINKNTNWNEILLGVECIIHCASRAHIIKETKLDSLGVYREINVEGAVNLANQAKKKGVKRLIFISSIGVNGIFSKKSKIFTNNDVPSPIENYAISKWEAEEGLKKISSQGVMELVIIRPPLVYGPGVKGNFLRLLNLVKSGVPLPLKNIDNKRSMLGLDNLLDFIACCIQHPRASGQTFLISDSTSLSTSDLIKKIGIEMNKSPFLFYVPVFFLKCIGAIIRKSREIDRLLGSYQIDMRHTYQELGWKPPFDMDTCLKKTINWYLDYK